MSWFGGGNTTSGASTTPFTFGAPTTAPTAQATSGLSTGFGGFGATPAASAPAATANPTFGGFTGFGTTPAATGTAPAPTFGTFGTGTTAPAAGTAPPPSFSGFGTGTAAPTAGTTPAFGFGAPAPAPTATTGFGFGQPAAAAATTSAAPGFGFSLGTTTAAPASSAAPAFSLGPTTTTTTQSGSLFGFGTATQPSTSATQQPAAFGFGTTPATTTSTGITGGGFTFGGGAAPVTTTTTAAAPATAFGFGTTSTAPTTSAAPLFGTTTTAAPAFGFGSTATTTAQAPFGLPAPTSTTSTGFTGFGLSATPVTSTLPTSTTTSTGLQGNAGLGGTFAGTFGGSSSATNFSMGTGIGLSGNQTLRTNHESVLDLPIPSELLQLVDELKTCVKNDKVITAEVSRASYKCVEQVTTGTEEVRMLILNTSNTIQRNTHNLELFKKQMNQDIKDAEMAQITRETPAVLQAENYLPVEFFYRLIADFENRMALYKREIKKAESAVAALDSNTSLNSRDFCLSLKSVKDSLLIVAAKVKSVHEKVNAEVETHKNLIRFVHGGEGATGSGYRDQQRHRWEQQSDEDNTTLFPSRIKDPAKLYMNYVGGSFENPYMYRGGSAAQGFGRSSSMFPSRFQPTYPGYGSATLFQSPSSPILNPHTASPPLSSTISLKRTKH